MTGSAGFTGRHVVAALVQAGALVTAVVRPGGSQAQFSSAVKVRAVDLRDAAGCKTLFEEAMDSDGQAFDCVFHVAAVFRTVGVSREELFDSHVNATRYLLDAANEACVRRFLHVSTIGVQGPNPEPNAAESSPANPADDYQQTKYEGEQLALAHGREIGLPVSVVRPCAIYGAGDDRFLKIIRPISKGRFTLIGSGDGLFHLVHVEDLARGMLCCAQADAAVDQVLTIGGPDVPSLKEFVDVIAEHAGGGVLPVRIPYAVVYAAGYVCEKLCGLIGVEPPLHRRRVKFFGSNRSFDLTQARELAGFTPTVSLATGVKGLVEWHRQRGDI